MKTTLSKDDRIVLDCLLSRLAGSLDGAVDFWTVVCVGQFPPGPRAFILQRSETLRALVVVVRLLLAEIQLDSFKLSDDLLQRMYAACQELQEAFLILAQFQSVSLEQLRSATEAVKAVYEDLRQAVRQLGQAISVPVSYWQGWTSEREQYYQGILAGLFQTFCHYRGNTESPAVVSSEGQ